MPVVRVLPDGLAQNFNVLAGVDLAPSHWEKARLTGFGMWISPRANLVPHTESMASCIAANAVRNVLGEIYRPHAPLVATFTGGFRPALCYLCAERIARPTDDALGERTAIPARRDDSPASRLPWAASSRACGTM